MCFVIIHLYSTYSSKLLRDVPDTRTQDYDQINRYLLAVEKRQETRIESCMAAYSRVKSEATLFHCGSTGRRNNQKILGCRAKRSASQTDVAKYSTP